MADSVHIYDKKRLILVDPGFSPPTSGITSEMKRPAVTAPAGNSRAKSLGGH